MTELQFLLHLLLEHKLPKGTKKLVADRIGEVETALIQKPQAPVFRPNPIAQAPSTQRILEEMAAEASPQPIIAAPPPMIPKIQGGLIDNGDGTKSKRKW